MKKSLLYIGIIAALILILAITAYVLEKQEKLFVRSPLLMMESPVVTYLLGEAEMLTVESDGSAWFPLTTGQQLREGDVVRTLEESSLDIRFSDRTAVRLAENTTVALDTATIRQLVLDIPEGTIFAKFEKLFKQQNFTVDTPSAVAGIRGTELVFEVDEARTVVTALSGITEVYNPDFADTRVLLAFQRRTLVERGGTPTEPQQIGREELTRLQQTVNAIHLEKVLLVTSTIQFEPNTDVILPESLPELDQVVQQLRKNSYSVRIDGHTANVGSENAMYRLSLERAKRIREYLIEQGIDARRLSVQGFGGTKPLTTNETPEGRAQNRRVEFVIVD